MEDRRCVFRVVTFLTDVEEELGSSGTFSVLLLRGVIHPSSLVVGGNGNGLLIFEKLKMMQFHSPQNTIETLLHIH